MLSEGAPPACQKNPARRTWRKNGRLAGLALRHQGRQAAYSSGSKSQQPLNLAHCDLEHMGEPAPIFRRHVPDAPIEAPDAEAMANRVEAFSERAHVDATRPSTAGKHPAIWS